MRVATRLSLALGSLIAIFVLVLIFHVRSLRTVVATEYALTDVSLRLVRNSSTQAARLDRLGESASKYAVTRDPGYLENFRVVRQEFATDLADFRSLPLSAKEREQADALADRWRRLEAELSFVADGGAIGGDFDAATLAALRVSLDSLRMDVRRVATATRETMEASLVSSAGIVRRAEWLSWGAAGLGLILSVGLSAAIVRSISRSLHHLGRGTRQIAAGNFAFRLPMDRSDEFAELARDFNLMNRRLGELDAMKRDFVSNVSHDLKTPLASMLEISKVLLDKVPGPLTARQSQLLTLHHRSGQRLSSMISNLLDLSAVEAGALKLRRGRHELSDMLRTAVASVEAARSAQDINLAVRMEDDGIIIEGDEQRLLQVLVNLLDNAIKFSPPGGRVEVRTGFAGPAPEIDRGSGDDSGGMAPSALWRRVAPVSGARRGVGAADGGGGIVISVADGGTGIAARDRARIFERFFQGEAGREGGRGVGLGLSISREIVEAHDGRIWLEANEGGGSVFHVWLPTAAVLPPDPTLIGSSTGRFL